MATMSKIDGSWKRVDVVTLTVFYYGSSFAQAMGARLSATVLEFKKDACHTLGVEEGSLFNLKFKKKELDEERTLAELGVKPGSELQVSSRKQAKRTNNYVVVVVVELYRSKEPIEVKLRCPSVSDRAIKTAIQNSEKIAMSTEEQALAYKDSKGKPIMVKNPKEYPPDSRTVKLTWKRPAGVSEKNTEELPRKESLTGVDSPAKSDDLTNDSDVARTMKVEEASGGESITMKGESQTNSLTCNVAKRDATPTLPEIIHCEYRYRGEIKAIKIPQEIGCAYRDFGILLLNDKNGSIIKTLEKQDQGDIEQINFEIILKWINGTGVEPVTWNTLCSVMKKVGLKKLAHKVQMHTE